MSNVLIGIIGVILFIGLALAGALFLGPRFQEASNTSKASAVVSAMAQASNAINLYETGEGEKMLGTGHDSNISTLVAKGYLKTDVKNPMDGGTLQTTDATGNGSSARVDHINAYIGLESDAKARSVCSAIERQSGGSAELTSVIDWGQHVRQNRRPGCFLYSLPSPGQYRAYMPI